ncbi:flavodoxin family protein [Geotalea sp. SG265]|uniref:flavodoxin family protein n=1 Tax=Geotalea sp. SG265 TaxID=2922867 RepID=UPI001FAEB72A|nr:flavodoxin family protein [Geotalea sp. SG265]
MSNIVAIVGSPRRSGNSATLTRRFLDEAAKHGKKASVYHLNDLSYRGCQACYACKTTRDTCILEDDLTKVLEAVAEAEVVVLASPVYFGDVTGQFKTFFDRAFSFFTPDYRTALNPSRLRRGKKLVFVQTQGQPDSTFFEDVFPRYDRFFKRVGFAETHLIRAYGVAELGDAGKRPEFVLQAETVAKNVFSNDERNW